MVLISLLCYNMNAQTCETSGSQDSTVIEVNLFQESGSSTVFNPLDIVLDSSENRYLFYELNGTSDENVRATKIASNGSYVWTKKYTGMTAKPFMKKVAISNDGSKIRMLSRSSSFDLQLSEISTSKYNFA